MILINKHNQTSKAKNEKTEKITKENVDVEPKHSMFEVKQEIVRLQIRERLTRRLLLPNRSDKENISY